MIRSLVFRSSGRRRRVIENPGIFRLVFYTVSFQPTVVGNGSWRTMKVPDVNL